jgi:hypothetical protein
MISPFAHVDGDSAPACDLVKTIGSVRTAKSFSWKASALPSKATGGMPPAVSLSS